MKTAASSMRILECMSSPLPRSYGACRTKMRAHRRTTAFVGERRGGAGNVGLRPMADGGWQMAEATNGVRRRFPRHPPSAIRHLLLDRKSTPSELQLHSF